MSKIQGLLKASPTVFKVLKNNENTNLSVKITLQKCYTEYWKISIKLLCLYLKQHKPHQIKAHYFYTDLGLYHKC